MDTKYAIVFLVGASDEPLDELDGRTPLEAADTPYLDAVAETGRLGTVRTIPEGLPHGSDVAILTMLGYDAAACYTGLAPIEAAAARIALQRDDVVFRCNLVTVHDGILTSPTAGQIPTAEAARIVESLNAEFAEEGVWFRAGLSYRCLMVVRDPGMLDAACVPPHEVRSEAANEHLPVGGSARKLRRIIDQANEVVSRHEVNLVRRDLGESPATGIWPWGQGVTPILRRFRHRFGIRGAAVGAVGLIRGLAKLLGWLSPTIPGATGFVDTDYAAKGRAAVAALDEHDLVVVHVEAPAEAAQSGDTAAKVQAIGRIDEGVIGPVMEKLRTFDHWRLLATPALAAPVSGRTIETERVPFGLTGTNVPHGPQFTRFDERSAAASDLHVARGCDIMEYLLRR